jgi:hypothetical protein
MLTDFVAALLHFVPKSPEKPINFLTSFLLGFAPRLCGAEPKKSPAAMDVNEEEPEMARSA